MPVQPEVVLCLGTTAAQSFMGSRFSVTRARGRVFETPWAKGPAAQAFADPVADLKLAQQQVSGR